MLEIRWRVPKLVEQWLLQFLYQSLAVNQIRHVVITRTHAFVGRNVITQSSTNQIHPTEIPRTSNLYVCKFTRPSSSSACEGLVPRLSVHLHCNAKICVFIAAILSELQANGDARLYNRSDHPSIANRADEYVVKVR